MIFFGGSLARYGRVRIGTVSENFLVSLYPFVDFSINYMGAQNTCTRVA